MKNFLKNTSLNIIFEKSITELPNGSSNNRNQKHNEVSNLNQFLSFFSSCSSP